MSFWRYVLRRAVFALALIVIVSSFALILTLVAPGDAIDEDAPQLDKAALDRRRAELGLDQPIALQYARWISRAIRLEFGESILYRRPVCELLSVRAGNTAVNA